MLPTIVTRGQESEVRNDVPRSVTPEASCARGVESSTQTFVSVSGDDARFICPPCAPAEVPEPPPAPEAVPGGEDREDEPLRDALLLEQIEDEELPEGATREARLRMEALSVRQSDTPSEESILPSMPNWKAFQTA